MADRDFGFLHIGNLEGHRVQTGETRLRSRLPPHPPSRFFLSRRFSRVSSATTSFSALASRRRSLTSSEVAARAVSPAHPEDIVDATMNDVSGLAKMGAFVEHSLCMFVEGSKFKTC